ncbi:MAG TPA: HAMP domain-containing sensor histidine kinase [Candidatus Pacearchaeota archaeon]|nr:HAMP domain-containing sensor histidine kinase [Candidatus Pacearchaeota archaeon]HPR79643.1 HAMP domain-containing sensor histidine kinase [Candidatus Pacearchaeota archaeon]
MVIKQALKQILNDLVGVIKNPQNIINEKNKEIGYMNFMHQLFMHEIINCQLVINSYTHLLKETKDEQKRLDMLEKMSASLDEMTNLLNEWSSLQRAGYQMQEQTLSEIFERCIFHSKIKINIINDNISIISIPAFKLVMYSMINNTVAHGGEEVTEINIDWQKTSTGITIIYEDNGVGIPDSQKSLIFKKGFGKHTGMGLFLAKQILKMTGFEIAEKGIYGKGARFEICIPNGAYRLY